MRLSRLEPVLVGLTLLLLAVGATWPLAADLNGSLLFAPRRFDGYGTAWLGEHFFRAVTDGGPVWSSTQVAWPTGLDMRRADSFLYGLLYLPVRAVFAPTAAFNVFCLVGITTTGLAGWWMARRALGTGPLGAFAAALILAFNSVMHTYRIEGEAYLLAGLFLPLLAGFLALAARDGRPVHGAAAGVCMGALAWSSGYYAVDGIVVCGVLGLALLLSSERRLRDNLPAVAACVGVSLLLVLPLSVVVLSALDSTVAARIGAGEDPLTVIAMDSASLVGLVAPLPETAHLRQGRVAYMGIAGVAFALGAVVMTGPRRALPWLLLATTGTLLALGPSLRITDADTSGAALPYAWLADLSTATLAYRMPTRFLAVSFVALGALTAIFLDKLRREGLGRMGRGLLVVLVGLDCLVFSGFALDETRTSAAVPSAYDHVGDQGALIDLWGHDRDLLRYAGLSAWYQVHHGRPAMVDFTQAASAQTVLSRRLGIALLTGDDKAARDVFRVLDGLGVAHIAFHGGSFGEGDANVILEGLQARCEGLAEPTAADVNDPVYLFAVPRQFGQALDAERARATLDAWTELDS